MKIEKVQDIRDRLKIYKALLNFFEDKTINHYGFCHALLKINLPGIVSIYEAGRMLNEELLELRAIKPKTGWREHHQFWWSVRKTDKRINALKKVIMETKEKIDHEARNKSK